MNKHELNNIFSQIKKEDLLIDNGIFVFHCENDRSIGVSYEHNEETNELVYIFNLFIGDEYININGEYKSLFDGLNTVLNEWNKLNKR